MMYDGLLRLLSDPLVVALVRLVEDEDLLAEVHETWTEHGGDELATFAVVVECLTSRELYSCESCSDLGWFDESERVRGVGRVCETCLDEYSYCDSCDKRVVSVDYLNDNDAVCERCLDDYYSYCDECETWYHHDNSDDHDHYSSCECEAPHPHFKFPANGAGLVSEDERITVELPRGTIDEEGIRRIRRLLFESVVQGTDVLDKVLAATGDVWQTARGNFTRRLSSQLHKHGGYKIPPGVVSEVGNVARAHSSESASWEIELTRYLNAPAEEFVHEDSCYWQSYSYSRCALKNWGAIGLRAYADESSESYEPNGRAWVQPLDDNLTPTHNAETAFAYVVFNGYGTLEGYIPARIIGHLTSRTYRKIGLSCERQYINNSVGYLVADQTTCEETERLHFGYSEHDVRDARTLNNERLVLA